LITILFSSLLYSAFAFVTSAHLSTSNLLYSIQMYVNFQSYC